MSETPKEPEGLSDYELMRVIIKGFSTLADNIRNQIQETVDRLEPYGLEDMKRMRKKRAEKEETK